MWLESLAKLLRRYAPLFIVTHFNHPKEITPEAREACERLIDHGVPVENQAVLMRRLNSDARIIKELNHACLKMRVRPYYLHQMDVAVAHSEQVGLTSRDRVLQERFAERALGLG